MHPIIGEISEDLNNYLFTLQGQIESISLYTQITFNEFLQATDPNISNHCVAGLYQSIRFIESPGFNTFHQQFFEYFKAPESDTSSIQQDLTTFEEGYQADLSVILEGEDQPTDDFTDYF